MTLYILRVHKAFPENSLWVVFIISKIDCVERSGDISLKCLDSCFESHRN